MRHKAHLLNVCVAQRVLGSRCKSGGPPEKHPGENRVKPAGQEVKHLAHEGHKARAPELYRVPPLRRGPELRNVLALRRAACCVPTSAWVCEGPRAPLLLVLAVASVFTPILSSH